MAAAGTTRHTEGNADDGSVVGRSEAAVSDKTLGQIAYEAMRAWCGVHLLPWEGLATGQVAQWEHIAQAVAQAVAPLPQEDQ